MTYNTLKCRCTRAAPDKTILYGVKPYILP